MLQFHCKGSANKKNLLSHIHLSTSNNNNTTHSHAQKCTNVNTDQNVSGRLLEIVSIHPLKSMGHEHLLEKFDPPIKISFEKGKVRG